MNDPLLEAVRASLNLKLMANAEAMTAAQLALDATVQRQRELLEQLRALPPEHKENPT